MSDFRHVHESVRPILARPEAERIAHLRMDRWIDYPLGDEILARLERLLTTPPRVRMPCLLIYGDSGMGKTMVVKKFQRAHMPTYNKSRGMRDIEVLVVQMPATPSQARFYGQILLAIVSPYRPGDRLSNIEPLALSLLKEIKPKMIVVDEVHHLLAGYAREQRAALNLLKFLANELQCSVVVLGTRDAQAAIHIDAQIASRFKPFELPAWTDEESYWRFLASFERLLPLKEPSRLADRTPSRRILDHSGGITGEITELLVSAAERALRIGQERITTDLIDLAASSDRKSS